jgi:glycosyltransferase involved in cell wall biosynthesis
MKKITLIVPSYKPYANGLKEALASVWLCDFDEIILLDDGSATPIDWGTIPEGKNVKLVRNDTNLGLASTRNVGIDLAQGDVISFLDDDDIFIAENIKELNSIVQESDADVWGFPVEEMDASGNRGGLWGDCVFSELPWRNVIPSGSWFRKDAWKDIGGYNKVWAEDWDFWKRLYAAQKKFFAFGKPGYRHRIHPGGGSQLPRDIWEAKGGKWRD